MQKRLFLIVIIALVALVNGSALSATQSPSSICHDTPDLYCFAKCDYYWGWCVEGSSACVMLWWSETCETDPGSMPCCMITARF